MKKDLSSQEKWIERTEGHPLFIIGPCSAESKSQLLTVAQEIKSFPGLFLFRAGVWKPRTRPDAFEGAGEIALTWLAEIEKSTGIRPIVEVASSKHVEACLNIGINAFWIGARTVTNPFSVQEIANAITDTEAIVMVKNPVHPDLDLWIGALERFYRMGITKLAAIHRGFFPLEKTIYRNNPKWEIAIELKLKYPQLPIFCDPSHICGNRKLIPSVSQYALDLNFDGLMLEVHPDPDSAKSDAKQQLSIEDFFLLNKSLKPRKSQDSTSSLEKFRAQIDSIDFQLLELLAERLRVVDKIAKYKKANNLSVLQLKRWQHILESRLQHAKDLNVDPQFIHNLLQLVHNNAIERQHRIFYSNNLDD